MFESRNVTLAILEFEFSPLVVSYLWNYEALKLHAWHKKTVCHKYERLLLSWTLFCNYLPCSGPC